MDLRTNICSFLVFIFLTYFIVDVVAVTSINHVYAQTNVADLPPNIPVCKKVKRMNLKKELQKFIKEEKKKENRERIKKMNRRKEYENKMIKIFERNHFKTFYKDIKPIFYSDSELQYAFLNQGYYATLYDTLNKIPVYSAYSLRQNKKNTTRYETWKKNKGLFIDEQPKWSDCEKLSEKGFDKGHLYPQLYAGMDIQMREYTNLITNMAPQYQYFNQNTWRRLEAALYKSSKKYCRIFGANLHFLTGVIPSKRLGTHNGITIPGYFWTAVCCDSSDAYHKIDKSTGWSFAYIVPNRNEKSLNVDMYFVEDFVKDWRMNRRFSQLFQNYGEVKECLFNPSKTVDVIKSMTDRNNKDRFFFHYELKKLYKEYRRSKSVPLKRPIW